MYLLPSTNAQNLPSHDLKPDCLRCQVNEAASTGCTVLLTLQGTSEAPASDALGETVALLDAHGSSTQRGLANEL